MTLPDREDCPDDTPFCARSCGRPGLYSITTGIVAVSIDEDPFCEMTELVCDPEGCP